MKVGDYVRTNKGIIGKIKAIDNQTELEDLYLVKRRWYYKKDIIKSSPNIIDLIEVGDYVNGKNVIKVWEEPFGEFAGQIFTILEGEETAPTIREIKSLLTKEQFESMEYKLEENK